MSPILLSLLLLAAPTRTAPDPLAMLPAEYPIVVELRDPSALARRVRESELRSRLGGIVPATVDAALETLAGAGIRAATIGIAPRLVPPGISIAAILDCDDVRAAAATAAALPRRRWKSEVLGGRLVLADSSIALQGIRDVLAGRCHDLLSREDIRQFRAKVGAAPARFHVDVDSLLPIRPALKDADDAGEALFFAHWAWAAATARSITGALDFERGLALDLEIAAARLPPERGFAAPDAKAAPALAPEGAWLGEISFCRDFAGFWQHREALLPPEARSGFAEFQNVMNILLGGLAIEDVFEGVLPGIDLHFARLPEGGPAPAHRYPMGALVATVSNERLRRELVVAFQEVIAFANAENAQKGRPRLLLGSSTWREVELHTARHLAADLPAPDDDRVQLEPTFAVVGKRAILGSHPEVVRRLIDAAVAGHERVRATGDHLRIGVSEAVAIARDNEPALAAAIVLRTGRPLDEARRWLKLAVEASQLADEATLSTSWAGDTATVRFEISAAKLLAPAGSGK